MGEKNPGWFDGLRVFVYGTLKPGGFYWPRFCEGKVEQWVPARVRGSVYHLPVGYPAAHFDRNEGWIEGVVLELSDVAALRGLDSLEGFDPGNPRSEQNDYRRLRVEAELRGSGQCEMVWAYEMSLEKIQLEGGSLVESGNWIADEWR
ncbi:MAG: gamma-glutamylcyclotransferase family protein [Puniceicoccales bacterium]